MTSSPLPAALRATAEGLYTLEAAAGLVIAHGSWLARDDFARFIYHSTGTTAIDWAAAIGALDAGRPSVRSLAAPAGTLATATFHCPPAGDRPARSCGRLPGTLSSPSVIAPNRPGRRQWLDEPPSA
jgi:hypothetical protein